MKKIINNIILNLSPQLPKEFPITYEEVKNWQLVKYQPKGKNKMEKFEICKRTSLQLELIYNDQDIIAGQFYIPIKKNNRTPDEIKNLSELQAHFLIAKNLFETKKNRCRFKIQHYDQLTEGQEFYIHKKFNDTLMPLCLLKIQGMNLDGI